MNRAATTRRFFPVSGLAALALAACGTAPSAPSGAVAAVAVPATFAVYAPGLSVAFCTQQLRFSGQDAGLDTVALEDVVREGSAVSASGFVNHEQDLLTFTLTTATLDMNGRHFAAQPVTGIAVAGGTATFSNVVLQNTTSAQQETVDGSITCPLNPTAPSPTSAPATMVVTPASG